MTKARFTGGFAAATAFSLVANAGLADVSAQQVWDDWQAYLESFGYEVSAEESARGDGLSVSDLTMSFPVPEEDMTVNVALAGMSFIDNGDGTVSIDFPSPLPVVVSSTGEDPFRVAFDYVTSGWNLVVAGDAEDMIYSYSADSLGMVLKEVEADGEKVDIGEATLEIADVEGESRMEIGNLRKIAQLVKTGRVSYQLDFADPENAGGRIAGTGHTESLSMASTTTVPLDMNMEEMGAAINNGFSVEGGYEFGPGATQFTMTEEDNVTQAQTSSQGGTFSLSMGEDGIEYGFGAEQLNVEFAGAEIPFPVSMAMQDIAFNLLMPIAKSDESQDFGLKVLLGEFTMSDMIWEIVDSAGQLPRDPATIAIDLTGQAKLFLDLLDPEQLEASEESGEMPGELNAVTLNDLTVSMVGAELNGTGDLTFDNTDMTSYEGMPKPIGTINLTLAGGNALLDKLVAMGLIPEDQAMGARMMMGLFAVPGDEEDTLKSQIEFNEEGQILANGQRLK